MKKLTKILLIAALVPNHINIDKEAGTFETGGLLWSLKKTPGEDSNKYTLELLPFLKRDSEPAVEKTEE
ncbi:MAG: hypothetical protein IJM62_01250 [Lachnospiraceae bacterium]|nr:hypothetical protein [Lachnospiraceae bacterium]